jgi:hypothetical protein
VIDTITDAIWWLTWFMVIPLLIFSVFGVVIATIALFVWLTIYTLITRAIAGIMSYDISFEQAFSISWLPWMIVKIIGTWAWLNWALRVLLWIIVMWGLIYYYKRQIVTNNTV